jgi:hypothetical protein
MMQATQEFLFCSFCRYCVELLDTTSNVRFRWQRYCCYLNQLVVYNRDLPLYKSNPSHDQVQLRKTFAVTSVLYILTDCIKKD